MILVSQNCLAANIYRHHLHQPFPHPFVYAVIAYNSMFNLITHWDDIDFFDYKIVDGTPIQLQLAHGITIQYVHYETVDLVKEHYDTRIARLFSTRDDRKIFTICNHGTTYPDAVYSDEQLNELSHLPNTIVHRGFEQLHPLDAASQFFNLYKGAFV